MKIIINNFTDLKSPLNSACIYSNDIPLKKIFLEHVNIKSVTSVIDQYSARV